MLHKKKFSVFLPLVFALLVIAGIFIGVSIQSGENFTGLTRKDQTVNKLSGIFRYIEEEYVDTISRAELVEKTMRAMLSGLDPHSTYISKEDLKLVKESLQGDFEGIGVEFNIVRDTLRVISVIHKGPAETAGLRAGDKIVEVEGKSIAGIKISNELVMKKLKGKGGTKVRVSVKRNGMKDLLPFTITRGTIPVYSVDAAFMEKHGIGFIRLNRFAEKTAEEFREASDKLLAKGMKTLILDLRGNPGGYFEAAKEIADEFLEKGKKIVSTRGKSRHRKDYFAGPEGKLENILLFVLIDEGSASASEIIAGAVQDNDKGTLVGRRSFGKGLVQSQFELPDSTAIRLTVARYYTPTGRCIQKPYSDGSEEYYREEATRSRNGELFHRDSFHFPDSLKYRTLKGKIVYGGGGIMPDVFVPADTGYHQKILNLLIAKGIYNQFASDFTDRERSSLRKFTDAENFCARFSVNDRMLKEFIRLANSNGATLSPVEIESTDAIIRSQVKAMIARNLFGPEGYYRCMGKTDRVLQKTLELAGE